MGIIAELKRRNVFRVGIAYLVLAWVVIQVTDTVSPALNLPGWTLSLVTWLGVIGFPFVLIFAWAFELTPEGIKREHEVDRSQSITPGTGRKIDFVIIGLLLVAVGFLLVDRYAGQDGADVDKSASSELSAMNTPESAYDSIAVLPFDNMSNDPEQEFFSDGITEELLNALARLRNLKVAARTSSFAFKGQQADIREIGKALNVATVLEGSLRKSGKRLRITAQLIDVESGYHLWSETYDRELTDVFAVQDDITAQIMSALQVHLEAGETAQVTTTTNAEAYEAYLKGRQALHERTLKSIQQAQGAFELATALDPDFALAWAGQALAVYLQSETNYGNLGQDETFTRANALINRALALKPDLGEAHAVRGLGYLDELRPRDALASLDRAVALSPGVAEFHLWRSHTLRGLGRWKESKEDLDHALQLDPLHPAILVSRAGAACMEGWLPATEAMTESLARYPQHLAWSRVICLLQEGAFADAFTSASASDIDDPLPELLARIALRDCETPWLFASGTGADAFSQALQCEGDKAAMTVYQKLPQDQKRTARTQAYLSIVQLRQGKYAESLNTLDGLYKGSLAGSDLQSIRLRDGSHLNLNRVLALQRLGRDEQAASVLAIERDVLEQARRDGMRRGYSLLEAKISLLSGNHELGLQALDRAFREFEIGWYFREDPVLQVLVGRQKLAEMTQWLDAYIDAERARLGWPPVGSGGLVSTGATESGR